MTDWAHQAAAAYYLRGGAQAQHATHELFTHTFILLDFSFPRHIAGSCDDDDDGDDVWLLYWSPGNVFNRPANKKQEAKESCS